MIVVTGSDPAVVSAVVAAAGERGVRAQAWAFRPDDPESDIVGWMRELGARVLIVVETLDRWRGRSAARPEPRLLEEALRAARSAHGARVVEGYPVLTDGDRVDVISGYVGTVDLFAAAGFARAAPTTAHSGHHERWVMRREL